jgi:hypothetical protein
VVSLVTIAVQRLVVDYEEGVAMVAISVEALATLLDTIDACVRSPAVDEAAARVAQEVLS